MDPIPPSAGTILGFALLVAGALLRAGGGRRRLATMLGAASAAAVILAAGLWRSRDVTAGCVS